MPCAFFFAADNAGSSIAAKIAMMAITTNSSIKVNPPVVTGPFLAGLDVVEFIIFWLAAGPLNRIDHRRLRKALINRQRMLNLFRMISNILIFTFPTGNPPKSGDKITVVTIAAPASN